MDQELSGLVEVERPAIPDALERGRVVAIMRHVEAALAVAAARALVAGGVPVIEVTMNSAGALAQLEAIRDAAIPGILLGAGTVMEHAGMEAALGAGATFMVSPHTDVALVRAAAGLGVPFIPGAATATEVVAAWTAGASAVKLFPAGALGAGYLKDLRGPLPQVRFLATGGIDLDNAPSFVDAGAWGLGLGSCLVDPRLVAAGRFDELEARARRAAEIARLASR